MILNDNQYEIAMQVPCWTDFDEQREGYREMLSSRFNENLADKILKIIEWNWSDFAQETAIVITVEGTKCLTWITDEFTPIECAEKVSRSTKSESTRCKWQK